MACEVQSSVVSAAGFPGLTLVPPASAVLAPERCALVTSGDKKSHHEADQDQYTHHETPMKPHSEDRAWVMHEKFGTPFLTLSRNHLTHLREEVPADTLWSECAWRPDANTKDFKALPAPRHGQLRFTSLKWLKEVWSDSLNQVTSACHAKQCYVGKLLQLHDETMDGRWLADVLSEADFTQRFHHHGLAHLVSMPSTAYRKYDLQVKPTPPTQAAVAAVSKNREEPVTSHTSPLLNTPAYTGDRQNKVWCPVALALPMLYYHNDVYHCANKQPDVWRKIWLHVWESLVGALGYLHGQDVLHADVKPENVLVRWQTSSHSSAVKEVSAVLGDFGISLSLLHGRRQRVSARLYTAWYRPPEIAVMWLVPNERVGAEECSVSTRADLWATGLVLWDTLFSVPLMNLALVMKDPVFKQRVLQGRITVHDAHARLWIDESQRGNSARANTQLLQTHRWLMGPPPETWSVTHVAELKGPPLPGTALYQALCEPLNELKVDGEAHKPWCLLNELPVDATPFLREGVSYAHAARLWPTMRTLLRWDPHERSFMPFSRTEELYQRSWEQGNQVRLSLLKHLACLPPVPKDALDWITLWNSHMPFWSNALRDAVSADAQQIYARWLRCQKSREVHTATTVDGERTGDIYLASAWGNAAALWDVRVGHNMIAEVTGLPFRLLLLSRIRQARKLKYQLRLSECATV